MTAPLNQVISRQKARWLKFVMHESKASATEKCLAYTIADALNCVTLDCWPSQPRLARLLGGVSVRTVQRAARGLEQLGLITIRRPVRTRRLSGMRRDFLKNLVTKLSMKPDSIVGERATPMSGNLL
jgi:helix-turn-helix protein